MLKSKEDVHPFTFVPNRNKDIPKKRFAKRTTSVRPITFFKNWDNTFSPSTVTEPIELNSPRCYSQPAQNSRIQNKNLSTDLHYKDGSKENNDIQNIPDSKKKGYIDKRLTVSHNIAEDNETVDHLQGNGSFNVYNDIINVSRKDKTANLESVVSKIQEKRKSIELCENDRKKFSANTVSKQNDGKNKKEEIQKSSKQSITNESIHHKLKHNKHIGNRSNISFNNEKEYYLSVSNKNLPVTSTNDKNNSVRVDGEHEQEPNVDKEMEGESNGTEEYTSRGPEGIEQEQNSGKEEEEKGHCSDREADDQNEEFNITHKIPLAQSTAIGIEIEQDFDDDEDDENNSMNTKDDFLQSKKNSSESYQQLKRKLTMSTPKRNVTSSIKKRNISITGLVKVQNIVSESVVLGGKEEMKTNKSDSRVKKKKANKPTKKITNGKNSSLTFDPQAPGRSAEASSAVPEQTPDLRKAMLLSYAQNAATPAGITPGYIVATPVSGPMYRNTQHRRPIKVPVPIEIASDSADQVDEVRLWQCEGESRRKSTDITDLDVTLQAFEELAWNFKESIEIQSTKKAVMLFAKKTQLDLRNCITQTHRLKAWRSSNLKVHSSMKKKCLDLLAIQKEYTRCKADLATLKIEHEAALIKSQRYTDALAFQQLVKQSQKELRSSLKENKGHTKRHMVCPKLEHHNTSTVSRKELENIQDKNKILLQRHCKEIL